MHRLQALFAASLFSSVPAGAQTTRIIPINRADIGAYGEVLDLDDEQVQVVEMLHEGYVQAAQRVSARHDDVMRDVKSAWGTKDSGGVDHEAIADATQRWAQAQADAYRQNLELQSGLFDDVRAVLRPDQADRMERVERMRRRQMLLTGLDLSWTRVDLVTCLERAGVAGMEAVEFEEAILQYEIAMDRELSRLVRFTMEFIEDSAQMKLSPDRSQMIRTMDELYDRARSIRGINKRHARVIATHIQEGEIAQFEAQVRAEAFPEIYRSSPIGRALRVAVGLADLEDGQAEQIVALLAQYERELESVNRAWASARDDRDSKIRGGELYSGQVPKIDPHIQSARQTRRELENRIRERLESILSRAQIERLPTDRGDELMRVKGGAVQK